jgi:hypothetical protein
LVALLQIHELKMIAFHDACWNMLCTEGFTELDPLYLVSRTSGGETDPPCAGITWAVNRVF